ncbi:MAG: right-handed parallel beta-helix repeat-containing protein [archaeon]
MGREIKIVFIALVAGVVLLGMYLSNGVGLAPEGCGDFDGDGLCDNVDNCPYVFNLGQEDGDGDGVGDVCYHDVGECGGNVECFCGDSVVDDFVMVRDLRERDGEGICDEMGVMVGKGYAEPDVKAINFDCSGFEIKGNGVFNPGYYGIRIAGSHENHVVGNCSIHGFTDGVYFSGGGPAFTLTDSEIFGNLVGVVTVGGSFVNVFNCSFYGNDFANNFDETTNVVLSGNHYYENERGVLVFCRTPWTADTTVITEDNMVIRNNLIENNNNYGLSFGGCSHSEVIDNVFNNNGIGFFMNLKRQIYRTWDGPDIIGHGYGADRTNNNVITGNNANNSSSYGFGILWSTDTIDEITGFDNIIENNFVDDKEVIYRYLDDGANYDGLDVHSFICTGCTNIIINNSQIREMYFGYSNDSFVENIFSNESYYGIYKVKSDRIDFKNITFMNNHGEFIYEEESYGNIFSEMSYVCGENDLDGDGICDGLDNCADVANLEQVDFDRDGVGDVCDNCLMVKNFNQTDENDNSVGDDCEWVCFSEMNGNNFITFFDLLIFEAYLGRGDCGPEVSGDYAEPWCNLTDINRDGEVDYADREILADNFAKRCFCEDTLELCDGMDNDCDEEIDEGCLDSSGGQCILGNVQWNMAETFGGQEVGVVVFGDNCLGVDLNISVFYENGSILNDSIRGTFFNEDFETIWVVDISDFGAGRYYFVASRENGLDRRQSGYLFVRENTCVDEDWDGLYDYDENLCVFGRDHCVESGFDSSVLNNFLLVPNNTLFNVSNFGFWSDLRNVRLGVRLGDGKERIEFVDEVSLINVDEEGCFVSSALDFDDVFVLSDTKIEVDGERFRIFDKPARIHFYHNFVEPNLFREGVECYDCILIEEGEGFLEYEVPGFSVYELVEGFVSPEIAENPGSPGGPGSPGITSNPPVCGVEWVCGNWSECVNGTQTRICSDVNNCGSLEDKPNEEQECGVSVDDNGDDGGNQEEPGIARRFGWKIFVGIISVIFVGVVFYLRKR